ncbi:Phytochrome, two-component sensor histidine kinase [Cystobacter fuscus DSM 2262]|uniref:histidine kinase n=1 Tax=Cystobacter fuscus (strain ATCC 25194 / DSM 2262 / NBRC 100088 / M29) TaxID=1242864 RepID=S9QFB3_CYSF2|nr:sensor histidine kinase [Cystobacter fuscus]EPX55043.1 Phytochrome, two-component sensor histidine kinase [Cystobacter fuscus DSM 2262]
MPQTEPRRFRHLLLRAVLLPLGLLLLLAGILLWSVGNLIRAQEGARHSQEALTRLERARQLLIDRETGLRGYLLTGKPAFLEPYQTAGQQLPAVVDALEQSLGGEPEQRAWMTQLRERWRDWDRFAVEELSLFHQGGDWLSLVRSGAGKARMDAIRATLDTIGAETRQRATLQGREAEHAGRTMLLVGGLWTLAVGTLLAWFSRRQLISLAREYDTSLAQVHAQADALRASEARLESRVALRTHELTVANKELETFSYSVSHDLRSPLRAIDGFAQALLEDEGPKLSSEGLRLLSRLQAAATRMGQLIDDLLQLSRVTRAEVQREPVDLSALATSVLQELRQREPTRDVTCTIQPGLPARGDARLLRVLLENLLGNAWKFTSKRSGAHIEFFAETVDGVTQYVVRDNGVGFDMAYAGKLFSPFQRMHKPSDFPGTGIGLATVQRVVHRHGGDISAQATRGAGATFRFTLQETQA